MAILACSIVITLRSYCFELYTLEFRLFGGTCEMLRFVFGFRVFFGGGVWGGFGGGVWGGFGGGFGGGGFWGGGGVGFRVQGSGFRVRGQGFCSFGFGARGLELSGRKVWI